MTVLFVGKIDVGNLMDLFYSRGLWDSFTYPTTAGLTATRGYYTHEGICNISMQGEVSANLTLSFPTPKQNFDIPFVLNSEYTTRNFKGTLVLETGDKFSINWSYEVTI